MTFSEQITVMTAGGGDFSSSGGDFTVTSAVVFGTSQVDLTVNTLSGTDFTSTDLDIAVDAVKDVGALTNGIAAIADRTVADGVAPTVVSAVTKDNTPDGYIDQIVITFSEDIAAGSIDVDGGSDDFSVAGYTILSAAVSAANEVTLTLNTGGSPDTGVTPDVDIVASQVTDLNAVAAIAATVGTSDGAAPYIVSSSVQSANAYFEVVFSEVVVKQGGGTLTKADFTTATASNGGATISIGSTLQDDLDQDLTATSSAIIRFILTATPTVLDVTGAETVSVAVNGTNVKDGSDNTLVGNTGNQNLNLIDVSNLLRIISAVPQPDNSYVTITFSEEVYRDGTSDRVVHIANSNNGQIKRDDYTNGSSLCDEDELCLIYNDNGTGVVINDNDDADIQWARNQSPKSIFGNNDNYSGPSFRLYLNDIVGTPTGKETYTLKVRNNSQISAKADPTKFMLDIAANQFTFYLADEAAPVFSPNPVATGSNVIGSAGIFSSDELITISADLGESGLTVTADLTNLLLSLSATQPMTEVGATGVYTYQLPIPAKFLNNGVRNIPITATDASVNLNSTTNSTLNVTVDSQGPALTVYSLITIDQTPLLEGLATGAASVSITIDGPGGPYGPYVSGGAVTLSGGSWSLNVPTTLPLGTFSVNVTGLDAESNSSADLTDNELLISNGVNITDLDLTQICVDGGYQTGSFAITETQDGDIQQGTSKVFSVQLPNGFVFNTAVIPTFTDTQGGGNPVTGSVSFPASNVLRVTYTASAGSLGQLNDITITNVQVATNLAIATATDDLLNLGGTASILGLDVGTDLGDVGSIQPGAPVASTSYYEFYHFNSSVPAANANPINITSNNVGLQWYEDAALAIEKVALNGLTNPSITQWGFVDGVDANNGVPDAPGGVLTYWVTQTPASGCRSVATEVTVASIRLTQSPASTNFASNSENPVALAGGLPSTNHTGIFSGPGLGSQSAAASAVNVNFIPKTAGLGSPHNINYTLTNDITGKSVTKTRQFYVTTAVSIFAQNTDGNPGNDIGNSYCANDGVISFDAYDGDISGNGRFFYRFQVYPLQNNTYDPLQPEDVDYPYDNTGVTGTPGNKLGWSVNIQYYNNKYGVGNYFIDRFDWNGVDPILGGSYLNNYVTWTINTIPTLTIQNLSNSYCVDADSEYNIEAIISNAGYTSATPITSWTGYTIERSALAGGGSKFFSGSTIDMEALGNDLDVGLPSSLTTASYRLYLQSDKTEDPNPASSCYSSTTTAVGSFRLYKVPSPPVLTGGVYNYDFCSDGVVDNFDFDFESPFVNGDITFTFYEDDGGAQGLPVAQNSSGKITPDLIGLANPSSLVNSVQRKKTVKVYVTQTFSGLCEGPARELFVNIYYEPQAPTVVDHPALGTGEVVIEYCQIDDVQDVAINTATLDNPANSAFSYFSWYANSDLSGPISTTAGGNNAVATKDDLGITGIGEYDFYVTQTDYLGSFASGCTSLPRKIVVKVVATPSAPILASDYFTCEGTLLPTIVAPTEAGITYNWYYDNGDGNFTSADEELKSESTSVSNADLVGAGIGYSENSSQTTVLFVTKLNGVNESTGFAGCEGGSTKIAVTVYPESLPPTIDTDNNVNHVGEDPIATIGGIDVYEFKYCAEDLTSDITFTLGDGLFDDYDETPVSETRRYDWFQASLVGGGTSIAKSVATPLYISGVESDPEQRTATASDLFLTGGAAVERYFLVSKTTNISDDYAGCESDFVAIKIVSYNTPTTPTSVGGAYDQYYCFNDPLNTITMNNPGGAFTFKWYTENPSDNASALAVHTGSFADETILANKLGVDKAPAGLESFKEYSFYVTQTNNTDSGIDFEGCESLTRKFTITVTQIPEKPLMLNAVLDGGSFVYAICEGEAAPTFSISNRAAGAVVQFWSKDAVIGVDAPLATSNNFAPAINLQYVPREEAYEFKVTQTTGTDNFDGCISEPLTFKFRHVPTASAPHTVGNDGSDRYVYCIGDEIVNLQIDNVLDGFTYRWYRDPDKVNLLGTTTVNNNSLPVTANTAFKPDVPDTYSFYVTSEETTQGCSSLTTTEVQVIINPLPTVTMTFDDDDNTPVPGTYAICVDNSPFNLVGSLAGTLVGTFKGTGITDNGDGTATFDPLLAVGLTDPQELPADENPEFTVTYTLTNSNGCVDSLQKVVRVKPLTVVDFSSTISFDDENSNLLVDVSESQVIRFTGNQSNGTFTGTGTTTTSLTTAVFAPLAARGEDLYGANTSYPITYGSSGTNGCYNEITKTVTVQPIPQIDLVVTGGCSSFDIDLTANVANAEALGGVSSVEWTIKGDASNAQETVIGAGINFTYTEKPTPGNYIFKAKVTGVNGAVNSAEVVRNIGSSPDPYIAWRHIVAGSPTIFSFDNRILPDQFLEYMKLEWVKPDGNVLIMERMGNDGTLNSNDSARVYFDAEYKDFSFPGEGDYTVLLTMVSRNKCVATTERVVHILPLVSVGENFTPHSFEAGTDGWWVDNTLLFTPTSDKFSKAIRPNDWETGTSGGQNLNSASVGQRAMFTKAGGLYQINQTAWVMSPAFDLSALTRPMVSFDRMFLTEARKDGVVFQYSVDNGDTWKVLGSYEAEEAQSTGENWYTIDGISSDPGSQDFFSTSSSRVGWAGTSLKTGEVDFTYASARQKLDLIPGDKKQVIFRFAFASNASEDPTDEGFAFDNFWIGNRTKQVLLEKFSSTTNSLSNNVDTQFQNELAVLANNNNDIIPIAYHTEFKGGEGSDPFNQLNKADAGSRVLFYGITDVPTSILSGSVSEETYRAAGASGRPFSDLELSRSSLRDPLASISIEQLSAGDTDLSFNVKVSRKVSTNGALPSSGEHRLYVAIVEDSLEFQGKPYQSVMRKLLPNGNGEIISGFAGLSTETVLTFPYTWEISGKLVKDPDHLKVVAFIQSNDTKLIYQAASLDIKGKQATETGVDLPGEIASSYALYPNPANTEVGVRFDSQLNNDFEWRLIDQAGATISNGRVQKGSEAATFDTRSVPSGMYFVIISNENARFEPKKLLIIH
ncbi:MAG: T9SS type A sorting domain-containing protein [Imperialibacter sp.]|uniref:T9SS type A sorting domain-containing protein n=1 Tax=Imperialibacter sp. TaxID=2038411 RepID=UPI0032EB1F53